MTKRYYVTRDFISRSGGITYQDMVFSAFNFENAEEFYQACLDNIEEEMRSEISRHEIGYQDIINKNVAYGYSLIREEGNDENDFTTDEVIDSFSMSYNHVNYLMERERELQ